MTDKINEIKTIEYACNGKIITFGQPLVMAIVNLTPDSFYDGGKYAQVADVLRDVEEKVSRGAGIIDLGAASSRSGAPVISESDEWQRLSPALRAIRKEFPSLFISIDTYRSNIASQSAAYGADIINDISGGSLDPLMFSTMARLNLPYILMHMQGTPQTMQLNPSYHDVTADIFASLQTGVNTLRELGARKIIIDPGFGFGKTLHHNYTLLKNLHHFKSLGLPILAGLSRKGMISKVIGGSSVTALNGTTVLNTIALLNGAAILRVHDVTEALEAINLVQAYNQA